MREIKFRYHCKDMSGKYFSFDVSIKDLEQAKLNIHTYGRIQEIIARCQFTGLKDKNGKDAYHHDLFIHEARNSGEPIEIIWENGSWKGKYTGKNERSGLVIHLDKYEMSQSEIIGTIHDKEQGNG